MLIRVEEISQSLQLLIIFLGQPGTLSPLLYLLSNLLLQKVSVLQDVQFLVIVLVMVIDQLPDLAHGGRPVSQDVRKVYMELKHFLPVGQLQLPPGQETVLVPVNGFECVLTDDRKIDELFHSDLIISVARKMLQNAIYLKKVFRV